MPLDTSRMCDSGRGEHHESMSCRNASRVLREARVEITTGRCISHIQLLKDLCHMYARIWLEYNLILHGGLSYGPLWPYLDRGDWPINHPIKRSATQENKGRISWHV